MPAPVNPTKKAAALEAMRNGATPSEVARELGMTRTCCSVWRKEAGIKPPDKPSVVTDSKLPNADLLNGMNAKARLRLAFAIEKQAELVASKSKSAFYGDLGNQPGGKGEGLASITAKIADTAAVIFGWSSKDKAGAVDVDALKRVYDAPNQTDQKQPNCVAGTSTLPVKVEHNTPQLTQPVENEPPSS